MRRFLTVNRRCLWIFALLFTFVIVAIPVANGATSGDASQAITLANNESQTAYTALRGAEIAGASVASLSQEFNLGLSYLQGAKSANASGSYDLAVTQAGKALETFLDVASKANTLESSAGSAQSLGPLIVVLAGVIGVTSATLGFHVIEREYRKWERRRLFSKRIIVRKGKHEGSG